GDGEPGGEALERLAVHAPARLAVVARTVVVERETRLLERLEVAADRARRDSAQRRQLIDRHAAAARVLDLAEDRPLPDDFRVPRHARIIAGGCRRATLRRTCRATLRRTCRATLRLTGRATFGVPVARPFRLLV